MIRCYAYFSRNVSVLKNEYPIELKKKPFEILINTIDCIGLENFNAKNKSSTQRFAEVYMVLIH